jgi:hypothetical protein
MDPGDKPRDDRRGMVSVALPVGAFVGEEAQQIRHRRSDGRKLRGRTVITSGRK